MKLYRAVSPDELADLRLFHRLRNPDGIVVKYFTLSEDEAVWFARQACAAFGDPPYAIIRVEIGVDCIPVAYVDRGVSVVLLNSRQPTGLVPARTSAEGERHATRCPDRHPFPDRGRRRP